MSLPEEGGTGDGPRLETDPAWSITLTHPPTAMVGSLGGTLVVRMPTTLAVYTCGGASDGTVLVPIPVASLQLSTLPDVPRLLRQPAAAADGNDAAMEPGSDDERDAEG